MADRSLCERVNCNVINREFEFYEHAHCLLDGEPGIHPEGKLVLGTHAPQSHFAPSELDLLLKHPVSNPLWEAYRRAADQLTALQIIHGRSGHFTERCALDRSEMCYFDDTLFQWDVLFVAILTDPACPVPFHNMRSYVRGDIPSVWAVRDEDPIAIYFESTTDLPIPSKQATDLLAYINERLRGAGIHLPRDFTITPGARKFSYHLSIPKGDCGKPGDRNT